MNTQMKKELLNDVLTGLLVAATFAAIVPHDALADLSSATANAKTSIATPVLTAVSYISYCLGTVMSVSGIAGAKKHADNASSNPLAPALGKLGAGAAFLAAPSVIAMAQSTGTSTLGSGSASFSGVGM